MKRAALALLAAALFVSPRASAGSKECIAAADDGQKLRDDNKLTAARDKFIACAAKACPAVVSKQCSQWLQDLDHDMPSMDFRVLDEQSKEILDVKVSVDGVLTTSSIDARAYPFDPGEHTVRVERADGTSTETKVMLRPGEKDRLVELRFAPPPSAKPPKPPAGAGPEAPKPTPFHVPLLGWVGGGVAVAGGLTTLLFALSANGAESDLRSSSCAPACSPDDKSSIDTKLVIANVGLVVGLVGLVGGVVITVLDNRPASPSARVGSTALDVGPTGLRGTF